MKLNASLAILAALSSLGALKIQAATPVANLENFNRQIKTLA